MEIVTLSSKGQIAIPKTIREALNLSEGAKLTLDVRGGEIYCPDGLTGRNSAVRALNRT